MANNLLTSLTAASRAHSHVVFNERTQEFERAGKRHAIASFFGSADARAKNDLTLQKIKEALNAEVADGVRFGGYGKVADGIFARVDVDRRIKSSTINAIIRRQGMQTEQHGSSYSSYSQASSGSPSTITHGVLSMSTTASFRALTIFLCCDLSSSGNTFSMVNAF